MWNKKNPAYTSIFLNLATSVTKVLTDQVAEICTQKYQEIVEQNTNHLTARDVDFDEDKLNNIRKAAHENAKKANDEYSPLESDDSNTSKNTSFFK